MNYVNNTLHGIKVPVKNGIYPPTWVTFNPGDKKELPDHAADAARLLGLVKVEAEVEKKAEVKKEVKAVKSTVHKNKVETKKVKTEA